MFCFSQFKIPDWQNEQKHTRRISLVLLRQGGWPPLLRSCVGLNGIAVTQVLMPLNETISKMLHTSAEDQFCDFDVIL